MAEQDIKMNQFQVVTDAPYVYVELADGSQGKIKKSDLIRIVCNATSLSSVDLNTLVSGGIYKAVRYTNGPNDSGTFIYVEVLSIGGGDLIQRVTMITDGKRYQRRYVNNNWYEWVEL